MVDGGGGDAFAAGVAGETAKAGRAGIGDPSVAPSDGAVHASLSALREALVNRERIATLTTAQVRGAAEHRPADLVSYCVTRAAQWLQERYRLDERFVELSLLVDQGEEQVAGRWAVNPVRYASLGQVLAYEPSPALVLLGPPGSGKTTMLQHEELVTAIGGVWGETALVPFYVRLGEYARHGESSLPEPRAWLAQRWSRRYPDLPAFEEILEQGRALLLLDGLNEIPAADAGDYRGRVAQWKSCLHEALVGAPGSRAVFSCRSLEYSTPLSTPTLRVPQVRIEAMDDATVLHMLRTYSPVHADEIWGAARSAPSVMAPCRSRHGVTDRHVLSLRSHQE